MLERIARGVATVAVGLVRDETHAAAAPAIRSGWTNSSVGTGFEAMADEMSFAERMAMELRGGGRTATPEGMSKNARAVAQAFARTRPEINDAIHAVKDEAKIGGARRNGDVWIHLTSGDVHAVQGDGSVSSDPMGNLLDFLR